MRRDFVFCAAMRTPIEGWHDITHALAHLCKLFMTAIYPGTLLIIPTTCFVGC